MIRWVDLASSISSLMQLLIVRFLLISCLRSCARVPELVNTSRWYRYGFSMLGFIFDIFYWYMFSFEATPVRMSIQSGNLSKLRLYREAHQARPAPSHGIWMFLEENKLWILSRNIDRESETGLPVSLSKRTLGISFFWVIRLENVSSFISLCPRNHSSYHVLRLSWNVKRSQFCWHKKKKRCKNKTEELKCYFFSPFPPPIYLKGSLLDGYILQQFRCRR